MLNLLCAMHRDCEMPYKDLCSCVFVSMCFFHSMVHDV